MQAFPMLIVRVVVVVLIFASCLCIAVPVISARCHLFCEYKRDYVCASWNYMNCSWLNECMVRKRNCLNSEENWEVTNRGYCREESPNCNQIKHTVVWTIR
uniref:Uncharacterized protein n=1 Tax=Glossina palpalis gambiensis TaxID=67801 RepID=A0A1B0BM87_9MUSC